MAKYLDYDGLEHFWGNLKPLLDAKADANSTVSNVVYDGAQKKLVKTLGSSVLDIVTVSTLKADMQLTKADVGLANADNTRDADKNVASAVTAQALIAEDAKPVSANEMHKNSNYRLTAFLATSAMRTGKPPVDAHVLHFNWDTGTADTGTRDAQLAISSNGTPSLYYRTQTGGTWSDWISVYSANNLPDSIDIGLDKVKNLQQKALHGGTALANRTNLNSLTTLGNYYTVSNAVAASLVNCPVNVAFHMYVGMAYGDTEGYEYQEIIRWDNGNRYYRSQKGSAEAGWTDWTEFANYTAGTGLGLENNAFYTSVAYTSETSKRLTDLGKSKYLIEEFAAGAEGLPTTNNNFFVLTATGNNVRYGFQLAMNENADGVFYRRIYNSIYTDWKPILFAAGGGISLADSKVTNTGVWSVEEGRDNGTVKVTTNGTAENVKVHGLGSRAYDSTEYLPLTGGNITGTVSASRSGEVGFEAENTNTNAKHKVAFIAGSNGNGGVYDRTFSKWIAYADKNGNVVLNGNANTATAFSAAKAVKLTGDVTGENSSTAGWTVATELSNTGVTAGNYGPTSNITNMQFGSSFSVPYFQVDAKGRIKSAATRTMTLPEFRDSGVSQGSYGPASGTTLQHGGKFTVPYIQVNAKGQITSATNKEFTLPDDKNTEYTAKDGIVLNGTVFSNSGVRSIATGTSNGTISVNTNGTAREISVAGLGSAAFQNTSAFAESGHTHRYAGSNTVGGPASSVANTLTLKIAGGGTEGRDLYTYNGSAGKTLNILAGTNITLTPNSNQLTIASKDTTYSSGTGISIDASNKISLASGVITQGSAGPTSDVTGNEGNTIVVPRITVDVYGRVTGLTTKTYTSKNTTYSASNGISLSGTTFSNSGVRSISTGSANGTISVNTNGTARDVAVNGLGSAAYTNSNAYAEASHTHNYAGSSSAGGAANSVANNLTLQIKGGTAEGSTKYTFNGSAAKTLNIKEGSNVTLTTASGNLTIAAKDTTYAAGTGLSLGTDNKFSLASGVVTAGTVGPSSATTGSNGTVIAIPRITVDTYGRVTGLTSYNYTSVDTTYTNKSASKGGTDTSLVTTGEKYRWNDIFVTSAKTVSSGSWSSHSDSYMSGFGYRAAVAVTGVTTDHFAEVVFKPADAEEYELCSVCQTYNGGIYIYAKEQPSSTVTILSIRCSYTK